MHHADVAGRDADIGLRTADTRSIEDHAFNG
jgi:hypothetical protein